MNEQALTPQPSPVPNPTPAKAPRRSHRLRNALIGSVAALALAVGGTAAWALDRFVIDHVEVSDVAAYEAEHSTTASASASGGASSQTDANSTASESSETVTSLTDTSYASSDGTSVTITRGSYGSGSDAATYYVADVVVSDATDLRSAFAGNAFGGNITDLVSTIATQNNAVLAINGDYYNYKDKYGLIIRNGVLYRDKPSTRDLLLVDQSGRMSGVLAADRQEGMGQSYIDAGIVQSFEFGPLLVLDGEKTELPAKYIIYTGDTVREPRTAIGQVDENHFVVIVADGRRDGWSDKGMTLQEMQQVFLDAGCHIAYNLDGGGSATMVLGGALVNKTSGSRERNVSDILYFTD